MISAVSITRSFIDVKTACHIKNLLEFKKCTMDISWNTHTHTHTHTHPFNGPLSGTTRVSRYQKGKPIWILLKQETMSGSGISWAICKSAPCSRQITTPAPHHSVFLQAGCFSCRPTNSVKALKADQHFQDILEISWKLVVLDL